MISKDQAVFTIGAVAQMFDISTKTLRLYEKQGLIKPVRNGKWRYYSKDSIKWIGCIRNMIHNQGISAAAIKKLLRLTTCWDIAGCNFEQRNMCTAFMNNAMVPKKIDLSHYRIAG